MHLTAREIFFFSNVPFKGNYTIHFWVRGVKRQAVVDSFRKKK